MPVFEPASTIQLFSNIPLDNRYVQSWWFNSTTEQEDQFLKYPHTIVDDCTYVRQKGVLRVPLDYDRCTKFNYVRYLNANYSNKWFYAFITEVEYVDPNCAYIHFELDVVQTWMFDWQFLPCFVERETVADDTLGKHTIPEGLELGPYKTAQEQTYTFNQFYIVLATSQYSESDFYPGQMIDGVFSGVLYRHFNTDADGVAELNTYLQQMDTAGFGNKIVGIFMVPAPVVDGINMYARIILRTKTLDGYTPRNNKMLCYPYRYFIANNYTGEENIYRYELFRNPYEFIFDVASIFNMQSSCFCYPMDYAGETTCWREGVSLSDFPQCSWNSNTYANWFAQNRSQLALQFVGDSASVVGGVASLATGNVAGALHSVATVAQHMAQLNDRSLYPYQLQSQVKNHTLNFNYQRVGFLFQNRTITYEYALIIDQYFSRYGYKVNRITKPQLYTRRNYNYLKTQGCQIQGRMPQDEIVKIEQIFDAGIALWHNWDDIGKYGYNPIINPPPEPEYPDPTIPTNNTNPTDPSHINWGPVYNGWKEKPVLRKFGWQTNGTFSSQAFVAVQDQKVVGKAIAGGRVASVGESTTYGKEIRVVDNSAQTPYSYRMYGFDEINPEIKEGVFITRGKPIGTLGYIGTAFNEEAVGIQITVNGQTWDPLTYVPNE